MTLIAASMTAVLLQQNIASQHPLHSADFYISLDVIETYGQCGCDNSQSCASDYFPNQVIGRFLTLE
jgi:hypothetical protein